MISVMSPFSEMMRLVSVIVLETPSTPTKVMASGAPGSVGSGCRLRRCGRGSRLVISTRRDQQRGSGQKYGDPDTHRGTTSGYRDAKPAPDAPRQPVGRARTIPRFLHFGVMTTRDSTRELLLSAALDQFGTFGFQRTTHADVAAAAGIARTTFYEYFSSTEELLVQLVETKLPELVHELIAGVPG